VIKEVSQEYEKVTGRHYDFIETYRTEDADYVAIAMGSTAGTMKAVVDDLRKEGHKVGCIKLRVFRPFPYQDVAKATEGKKAVAVMDRAISFGASGPLFADIRSAEFENRIHPRTVNYVYGLGGRDVGVEDLKTVFKQLESGSAKTINYLGVKQ
jgi:pyruvate ferredoxin oxidoreductase alpha subunit